MKLRLAKEISTILGCDDWDVMIFVISLRIDI